MHCANYSSGLAPDLFNLYASKLKKFDIKNPYEIPLSEFQVNGDDWPQIQHGDIVNYLVFGTHAITHEEMKSYKSLEAHNYFTSGWVDNQIFMKVLPDDRALMLGSVKHSQSLRSAPLKVWMLCKQNGEVLTGHCNCMAGMGEACSHIGALLFFLEAGVRLKNDVSCTDKRNIWLQPCVKNANFSRIKDIDFESAAKKFKKSVNKQSGKKQRKVTVNKCPEPNDDELFGLFTNLNNTSSSVILTVVEPFNNQFITDDSLQELNNLYCTDNTKLSFEELMKKCREVGAKVKISDCNAKEIEIKTKSQSKSKKWYSYRTGRITASNMKAVCSTNIDIPSISLIKKICYPNISKFSSVQTKWGKVNEISAKQKYVSDIEKAHTNFQISDSGLHIHTNYPYIGATPDGIIQCDCCGIGDVEIKCPYVCRDRTILDYSVTKYSCLTSDEVGNLSLSKNHEYYYQVQTQLFVTDFSYCDFVVWTNKDIFVERIYPDEMMFETISENSQLFFYHCVLPELLAKWYSNNM